MIGYTLSQVKDARGRGDRRDAVLQGPDARRAARGARAPARSAGRARRDGGRDRARSEEPARRHRGDGRAAEAAAARLARRADRSSPTSSRKRRWPTPSSSRCSTSCGRSACRSSDIVARRRDPRRDRDGREPRRSRGDVEVRVDAARGRCAPIQGDPHQLRQIFTNLLTNAFEAMGGRGRGATSRADRAAEERRRRGAAETHAVR